MRLTQNPFAIGPVEIDELDKMVNREEETKRVQDFVRYHQSGTILLSGERGIGKTTILNKLSNTFRKEGTLTAMIGIYHFELDKVGFIAGILRSIVNELEKRGTPVQKYRNKINRTLYERQERVLFNDDQTISGRVSSDREVRTIVRPDTYKVEEEARSMLIDITKTIGKLVLLIDDLDKLNEEGASAILLRTRPVLSIPDVFLIFSVSDYLMRYMGKEIKIARSVSDLEITLKPLTNSQLVEIIRRRLNREGISDVSQVFDEDALTSIIELSKGNTREFMSNCSEVFDMLLSNNLSRITYSDVMKSVQKKKESFISQLDEREAKVLKYIIERGRVRAGDSEVAAVLGVGRPRASQIFNNLTVRGLLIRESLGKYAYYVVPEEIKRLLSCQYGA
jgi:DNA polymerase III delta prime subunit